MSTAPTPRESERRRFPAMLPREALIWRGWLQEHEREYDRFEYNVRLGEGLDPGPSFPDFVRRDAVLSTQKRVDAVGFRPGEVWIFEVKERAGLSAIGQLIGYRSLWRISHPDGNPVSMALVTNVPEPDLLPGLRDAGITLFVVDVELPVGFGPVAP